jgi:hypothetical protein
VSDASVLVDIAAGWPPHRPKLHTRTEWTLSAKSVIQFIYIASR